MKTTVCISIGNKMNNTTIIYLTGFKQIRNFINN